MSVPLNVREIVSAGSRLLEERGAVVRVAIFVDPTASDMLIDTVRNAFSPQTVQTRIHVELIEGTDLPSVEPSSDLVVVVATDKVDVSDIVKSAAELSVPVVVVAGSADEVSTVPAANVVAGACSSELEHRLGQWLVENAERIRLPLAANFVFVRRAVAQEAVRATAFQNAIVGGVMFIPGADMPVMTANQAKMLLQIAAAYGQPLGTERVKELAVVVGGAFALRTVARQLVGVIPGLGWAVKAAVGYSGTLAMGRAAIEYFEAGGDVQGLAQRAVQARDAVMEKSRRSGLPEPDSVIEGDS